MRALLFAVLAIWLAAPAFGQAAAPLAFDTAEVRVSRPGTTDGGGFISGGRTEFVGATMLDMIASAWNVEADRVIGGPAWLNTDRYDVAAVAKPGSSEGDARLMFQALLADRFRLTTHREDRDLPIYVLTVAKRGAKLKEASAGSGPADCNQKRVVAASVVLTCKHATMAELVERLSSAGGYVDHPAADQTGLKGRYDFSLNWTPRGLLRKGSGGADDSAGPNLSLFDALDQQLGLKLEARQQASFVIVIDHVDEKPSESATSVTRAAPPAPKEFELAAVHPSPPDSTARMSRFLPGGQVELRGFTFKELVAVAYEIEWERVTGGPKWLDSDRFDIVAKTAPSTPNEAVQGMLKALLVDRFKLVAHYEDRPTDVYALTLEKRAPKLTEAAGSERSDCKISVGDGVRIYTCQNTTMAQLAEKLPTVASAYFDHPMVDTTGLKGAYNFTVSWAPKGAIAPAAGGGGSTDSPDPTGALTVFEAVDRQLGLKLSVEKHPMPMLVIDSVERAPTDN
jgi:uncharacterized protein (TIGR03435 family)